jgi:hypothetical protein
MAELRIVLNSNHPNYERIANGIRRNLDALDSVTVKEVTVPQKPGTLTAEWTQVTEFVLQHSGQLIDLTKAVIEMGTAVILMRAAKGKDSEKPVVIKSGGDELALPASDQKKKKFLTSIKGVDSRTPAAKASVGKERRRSSGKKSR